MSTNNENRHHVTQVKYIGAQLASTDTKTRKLSRWCLEQQCTKMHYQTNDPQQCLENNQLDGLAKHLPQKLTGRTRVSIPCPSRSKTESGKLWAPPSETSEKSTKKCGTLGVTTGTE